MSYDLGFIADDDLLKHVKDTVSKYRFDIDLKAFNKNLIDPVKATFDAGVYNLSIKEVIEAEVLRQIDKSNTNHIGYFHQNIFKYIGGGWSVPKQGYDIVNKEKSIYVELKNKHNTMNSSSSQKTYIKMQHTILDNDEAVCLLVEVIAKKSQNEKWVISLDGQQKSHKNIRRVSIDKFYKLVTGQEDSFKKLCEVLPRVIQDSLAEVSLSEERNTVFSELQKISPDILKSLYLLSFSRYEGFEKFNVSK